MMRGLLLVLSVTCSLLLSGQESNESVRYARWNLSPSIGYAAHLHGFGEHQISDALISYPNHAFTMSLFSADVFFNKNFGLSVGTSLSFNLASESKRQAQYNEAILNRFGSDYFLLTEVEVENNAFQNWRFRVGPVYRFEQDEWYFQLRFQIANTELSLLDDEFILKEKGSNTVLKYELSASERNESYITYMPSILVGNRVLDRLVLFCSFQYEYFRPNFYYTETVQNVYSEDIIKESRLEYNSGVHAFNFSAGLIIEYSRHYRSW